jgi:RimJ/RimL family protein N-acetyltransferase
LLDTKRLMFRRYTYDDLDFLASLLADPNMVRYIGNGVTRTREEAVSFLEWILGHYEDKRGTGLMLAIRKEDSLPIGHVGLVPQRIEDKDEIEVGYWIARNHWGQGLATEAASAFLRYGQEKLGLNRMVSLIQPGNLASIAVAQKIGMRLERMVHFRTREVCLYTSHHNITP